MSRDRLGSRLGFILLSVGCAIGIGNVWKFPWMVGQNGGAIFILIYVICLILLGIPILTMEFAVGRAAQKSPTLMFRVLEPKNSKWHIHGIVCLVGNIILMMFYSNVAGWMVQYFVKIASGTFEGKDTAGINAEFGTMLGDPLWQTVFMAATVIIGTGVCMLGVRKGLERVTKVMMVALLILMTVLVFNSIFLDGGAEGLRFYLVPDFDRVREIGIFHVIVAAMNQAFFTLSLGMGSMAIFGSYLGKDRALMGEAVNVAVLDTFVAFASGLIIFPACFAYGINPGAGPALVFQTLPNVFCNMPMGRLWGSLFFVFMSFAALSTVLAVFESIIACILDLSGWGRIRTCVVVGVGIFLLSLPCVFGYNLWSGFSPFGGDTAILDLEDFVVSQLLLPLGALVFTLFCVTRYGWGWKNFMTEANMGRGLKIRPWMRWIMTILVPVIVLLIFVMGIVTFDFSRG